MINTATLLLYTSLALGSYVVPGPDWVFISGEAFKRRKNGFVAALGVQSGLLVHMLLGALGATAILATSDVAFRILQGFGAVYLIYMGIKSLNDLRKSTTNQQEIETLDWKKQSKSIFIQGFWVNVLNPKAALFFISILPQFVQKNGAEAKQVFFLGFYDIAIGLVWWFLFCMFIDKLNQWIQNTKAQRMIQTTAALMLLAFGLVMLVGVLMAKGIL